MNSVEVSIFGRIYRLRTSDPAETIIIATELDKQLNDLRERYEIHDFTKLLMLVAFQQQESLHSLTKQNEQLSSDLDRLNIMISKILGEV